MRLWSIHPKYLDTKGLVAVWRESLLAKSVLLGLTRGYINHPQLERFKRLNDPIKGMDTYLYYIYQESLERGYMFNISKIGDIDERLKMSVTKGQVEYEFNHLIKKLGVRDVKRYENIKDVNDIQVNPIFNIMDGDIEDWEKVI